MYGSDIAGGGGAAGAGALAVTGFSAMFFAVVGVTLLLLGFVLVRIGVQHHAARSSAGPGAGPAG